MHTFAIELACNMYAGLLPSKLISICLFSFGQGWFVFPFSDLGFW